MGLHRTSLKFAFAAVALLTAAALVGPGCDSRSTHHQSSPGVFFAPVPLSVDAQTGINPNTGQQRVEILADKIDILKIVKPDALESDLRDDDAETVVLGKISEDEAILYERRSSTLIQIDLRTGALRPAFSRTELSNAFRTSRATFAEGTTINIGDFWIFGYESSSRSIFVIRKGPPVQGQSVPELRILANARQIQTQIFKQTFNFISAFEISSRTEFEFNQNVPVSDVLLTTSRGSLNDLHLFVIKEIDGEIQGSFCVFHRLTGEVFCDPADIPPGTSGDNIIGLVNYGAIQQATQTFDIDIFDFKPISLPDRPVFLLFDRQTSTFIRVTVFRDATGQIIGSEVCPFSSFGEVGQAIRQGSPAIPNETLQLLFRSAFLHPSKPLILTFEETTNNLVQISFDGVPPFLLNCSGDNQFGRRIGIFSPSTNVIQRRDLQGGIDPETGPQEPSFAFSLADVRDNRLVFDQGTDEILSLNYQTSQFVVVLKQQDIGVKTGLPGISDLTFMEPFTPNEIRIFDTQGNAYLKVRIEYAAFPVRFR